MKKAISLDSMQANEVARLCRSNSVISFKANRNEEYYLDLKDNAMAIVRDKEVATFFKFSRRGQQNETVSNFLRKKPYLDYNSKDVFKGFQMAVGR